MAQKLAEEATEVVIEALRGERSADNSGWGFGVAVVTRRDHVSAPVGSFGWAGLLGTSWRSDPSEDMVVILLTQASWTSLVPGRVSRDFGILAYQAIDD